MMNEEAFANLPSPPQYNDPFKEELGEESVGINNSEVDIEEIEFSRSLCQDKVNSTLPAPILVGDEEEDYACGLCCDILKNGKECRFCEKRFCLFCIEKQVIKTNVRGCPACG